MRKDLRMHTSKKAEKVLYLHINDLNKQISILKIKCDEKIIFISDCSGF
jgi:hypothetical protein